MRTVMLVAATVAGSAPTIAPAQPAPSSHDQHQAAGKDQPGGQHQATAGEDRCHQMMQEMHAMMTEMMKMHQGMAGHSSHDANKDKPQEQPKH